MAHPAFGRLLQLVNTSFASGFKIPLKQILLESLAAYTRRPLFPITAGMLDFKYKGFVDADRCLS